MSPSFALRGSLFTGERCKHGMDCRFCSLCNLAPKPPHQRRASGITPRTKSRAARVRAALQHLDYRFDNDGKTLVLTADISKGWRKQKRSGEIGKTFVCSEVRELDWQGGAIRVQLSLLPRPYGLTEQWENPPDFVIEAHRHERFRLVPEVS